MQPNPRLLGVELKFHQRRVLSHTQGLRPPPLVFEHSGHTSRRNPGSMAGRNEAFLLNECLLRKLFEDFFLFRTLSFPFQADDLPMGILFHTPLGYLSKVTGPPYMGNKEKMQDALTEVSDAQHEPPIQECLFLLQDAQEAPSVMLRPRLVGAEASESALERRNLDPSSVSRRTRDDTPRTFFSILLEFM